MTEREASKGSPVRALGRFLATLLAALSREPRAHFPLTSDDGNLLLDHVVSPTIRQHAAAVMRPTGDRIEMVLQPAIVEHVRDHSHLSPLQVNLRRIMVSTPGPRTIGLATDGAGFYTALFGQMESELGLLLRMLYVVPAGAAHTLVVPVFRLTNYPLPCTFDEEIPAVAFGLLLGVATPTGPIVAIRTYEAGETHWTQGKGGERDPRLRAWHMPAQWPAPQWLAVSWVDPQCHLWPVGRDPAALTDVPAYRPTHYWSLPPTVDAITASLDHL